MRRLAVLLVLLLLASLPAASGEARQAKTKKCSALKSKAKRAKCVRKKRCAAAKRKGKPKRVIRRACRKPAKKKRPAAPRPAPAPPPAPPQRWTPQQWQDSLSEEQYTVGETTTHYISAQDGTQLALTVTLPAGLPPGAKIPTLLQLSPYRPFDQALRGDSWNFFVRRGAAYVQADERGTGGSEGCLDFGGSADRSDTRDFTAWIRSQDWSNGRIVTDGISHPGMGSVVAHAADPALTGALAHAPVVSYYQDEWLQGAKFEDQQNGIGYQGIELLPPGPPEHASPEALQAQVAPCTGETLLDYASVEGPFGPVWADRDLSRHTPSARIPILLTHGFVDLNVHPDHSQLYWDALPDDYPKYAIFGWWYHGWPTMPDGGFQLVRHRWMDWLLFGRENGMAAEPRVLVQDSTRAWHEGRDWPLEQSEAVTLHPTATGGLSMGPGAAGTVDYQDALGAERGRWTGASAVFRSDPLPAARLVNGAPTVQLTASSSADETKWVAYLIDEAPDGTWQRVSHGYADSHTWKSEDTWTPMAPGTAYRWTLKLMPTAVVLGAGHKLVLVIASQDSGITNTGRHCFADYRGGCYAPSGILPATTVGRAVNSVHVGPGATSVSLSWADPAATRRAPFPAAR